MKNLRSSASSSRRPSKIVVAFGEKPAQKPNSLSPRLRRKRLSSVCANAGALAQVRSKAMKKSFIKCPLQFFSRNGAAAQSLRFLCSFFALTLRLCAFAPLREKFLDHLFPIFLRVLHVVFPKHIQISNFLVRQRPLHLCRKSHHQRSRRDYRARTDERASRNQRQLADAHVVQQYRTDANQTATLDVAAVQSNTMAHRHLVFEYRRVCAIPHVNHRIVLHVGAVADANVMNITTYSAVAPDRSLFSKMHVAYHLGAGVDICGRVNLRVNPTERSNH